MIPGSARNWIAVNAVQTDQLNEKTKRSKHQRLHSPQCRSHAACFMRDYRPLLGDQFA
jgi:hypothetical protein